VKRLTPLIIAALALSLAVPAAEAKSFKVKAGRTVVKHVNAPSEGRLALSAVRTDCSRSVRVVVKRRGRVVLRGRLGSKRAKVLKGAKLAAGRHRLTLKVKGSGRRGRCKPRVDVRRLWVAPAGEAGEGSGDAADPPDPEDDDGQNGPEDNGGPPPALPGEDDETNEDADA